MIETATLLEGIESVLEELRPSLAMHGGNANLMKFEDGVVYLKLEGACQGCPMSTITFGMALKETLREKFPNEVQDVVWN
ncbi:MAG: NifU family protein [bacterium]|nr:NifU family protein [bacterium]